MATPVGFGAAQTFSSVRAGLTRMREAADIYTCLPDDPDFEDGQPLTAATLSYLESPRTREAPAAEWISAMAAQAFFDLQAETPLADVDCSALGLFVSLPAATTEWDTIAQDDFIYHFHNRIERDLFAHTQCLFDGHAGALSLIEPAVRMLDSGRIQYALVGGADSYLFPDRLASLDRDYRIKSERSPDGFIPGEAAAWLLLECKDGPRKRPGRALASLLAVDGQTCGGDDLSHNTGMALSGTLKAVLALNEHSPEVVYCDLNGETARSKEWGYTLTRLGALLGNPLRLEHPADCLGDLGAAAGAVLTGLACRFIDNTPDSNAPALIWSASDTGLRAGLLIGRCA